jgi:hypothetical protein
MTTDTAKIYQFPLRGRMAQRANRDVALPRLELGGNVSTAPSSDGWYHEAAIQDTKRSHEH